MFFSIHIYYVNPYTYTFDKKCASSRQIEIERLPEHKIQLERQ